MSTMRSTWGNPSPPPKRGYSALARIPTSAASAGWRYPRKPACCPPRLGDHRFEKPRGRTVALRCGCAARHPVRLTLTLDNYRALPSGGASPASLVRPPISKNGRRQSFRASPLTDPRQLHRSSRSDPVFCCRVRRRHSLGVAFGRTAASGSGWFAALINDRTNEYLVVDTALLGARQQAAARKSSAKKGARRRL